MPQETTPPTSGRLLFKTMQNGLLIPPAKLWSAIVGQDWATLGLAVPLLGVPLLGVPLLLGTSGRDVSSWEQALIAQPSVPRSPLMTLAVNELGTPPEFNPAVIGSNFPTFNSQRLDQQIRLYANYLATLGPPDVLIVGSSRSLQGIDPEILQQALAAKGLPNLRIYNFGINGATAQVVDLVLRRILTPNQLPRLIIWADGSRAFNSARADLTYNSILASEGYKQLLAGSRPIRPVPPASPLPNLQLDAEICVGLPQSTIPLQQSSSAPVCILLPPLMPPDPADSLPTIASTSSIAVDLTDRGFQPVPTEFNPAAYYRRFPRVSGRYDSNYTPFRLEGEQTTAAIAIARFARSQRISLVFVSLPLTREYLDPVRIGHEQRFRQYMQQLAAQEGFLFRDLMQRWSTQNNYFADPSHLNRNGARAVAQYLATDTAIPWLQLRSVSTQGR